MLGSTILQYFVFPVGVLYLLLHVGPLLRLFYQPSIRGGTRWRFFASEIGLFALWLLGSPVLIASPIGRLAIAVHLSMHVVFTATDYLAHDFLLRAALCQPRSRPFMWAAKELGLVIDTLTHGIAVGLVAAALPPQAAIGLALPALLGFAGVTRGYLRRYGAV